MVDLIFFYFFLNLKLVLFLMVIIICLNHLLVVQLLCRKVSWVVIIFRSLIEVHAYAGCDFYFDCNTMAIFNHGKGNTCHDMAFILLYCGERRIKKILKNLKNI